MRSVRTTASPAVLWHLVSAGQKGPAIYWRDTVKVPAQIFRVPLSTVIIANSAEMRKAPAVSMVNDRHLKSIRRSERP